MKKQHFVVFAALLLAIAFILCVRFVSTNDDANGNDDANESLHIAAVYPLTGPLSALGEQFHNGLTLAVETAQEENRSVRLTVEDGKASPSVSIAAMQKLVAEGDVDAVVTTVSGVSLAIKPIAVENEILLFADAAHPDITVGGTGLVFRHNQIGSQEAEVIGEFISETPSKTVALLTATDEYSKAFGDALFALAAKSSAFEVVGTGHFDPAAVDSNPAVLRIQANTPDIVVLSGIGKPLGNAISNLRENGFSGTIIVTMGFTVTPDAQVAAGAAAGSVWHTRIKIDVTSDSFVDFSGRYRDRFGQQPHDYAVLSFNTANLIIDSYFTNDGPPNTSRLLADRIKDLGVYSGAGERMSIKPNGDILPEVDIVQFASKAN